MRSFRFLLTYGVALIDIHPLVRGFLGSPEFSALLKPHLFDGVATRLEPLVRSARITPDLTTTDIGADTEKAIDFARRSVNIMVYAAPNDVVAFILGAFLAVVAVDAFANVFSAHPSDADLA